MNVTSCHYLKSLNLTIGSRSTRVTCSEEPDAGKPQAGSVRVKYSNVLSTRLDPGRYRARHNRPQCSGVGRSKIELEIRQSFNDSVDLAVGVQVDSTVTGWQIVKRKGFTARFELDAGGRSRHPFDAIAMMMGLLVYVTPQHRAHIIMRLDRIDQRLWLL